MKLIFGEKTIASENEPDSAISNLCSSLSLPSVLSTSASKPESTTGIHMNPYRNRSQGTAALEAGQRRRSPPKPGDDTPFHQSAAKQPFETANVRPVVSRFGGMVYESSAVHIPAQVSSVPMGAMDNDTDFESRCRPEVTNVFAGIPGYQGYKPHGAHHKVYGTDSAPQAHNGEKSAADLSHQPYIMPVVGYAGHIRGLADADKNYGTTHWKNSGQINPTHKAAASKGWDGRDSTGRPFGGWTPGDFGRYPEGVNPGDEEYEREKREADEANEILELRSMGIRALIQNRPELGGSRSGPRKGGQA